MAQDIVRREEFYLAMLNRLYTANVLTSSEMISVVKDLCATCNRTKYIKKVFSSFESLGISVLPDVLFHRLRFKGLMVVVNARRVRGCAGLAEIVSSTPYIRSILVSPPKRIVITFYIPSDNADPDTLIPRDSNNISTHIYNYVIRAKPIPDLLFSVLEGSGGVDEDSFGQCIESPLALPEDWDRRPRITSLALYALDVLSINPTLTIEEVATEISKRIGKDVSPHKVKKHVYLASRFIYGYRVAILKAPYVSDVKRGVLVGGLRDPARFCLSIIRHPLAISCAWNSDEASVYMSIPEVGLSRFSEGLYWFIDQFRGEVLDQFEYIASSKYATFATIPYGDWHSLAKSWKRYPGAVQDAIRKLQEHNCVEL